MEIKANVKMNGYENLWEEKTISISDETIAQIIKRYEKEQLYLAVKKIAAQKIWTTSSGMEIPVSEMSDLHIKNIINFIKRDRHELLPWIDVLEEELKRRGETDEIY